MLFEINTSPSTDIFQMHLSNCVVDMCGCACTGHIVRTSVLIQCDDDDLGFDSAKIGVRLSGHNKCTLT